MNKKSKKWSGFHITSYRFHIIARRSTTMLTWTSLRPPNSPSPTSFDFARVTFFQLKTCSPPHISSFTSRCGWNYWNYITLKEARPFPHEFLAYFIHNPSVHDPSHLTLHRHFQLYSSLVHSCATASFSSRLFLPKQELWCGLLENVEKDQGIVLLTQFASKNTT